MAEKQGPISPEGGEARNPNLATWDRYREHSPELQRNVAEILAARLGVVVVDLMRRSDDNSELINNLKAVIGGLEHQAAFGDSQRQLGHERVADMANFLGEVAKALRWNIGANEKPADLKVDLSRWEVK